MAPASDTERRKRVHFRLDAPDAEEVKLVGSFNGWNLSARPLKRGKDGIWQTYRLLRPGVYEYRFVVDGDWADDPEADRVPNEFGSENSMRTVA